VSARDRFIRDLDELIKDYSPRARDLLVRDLDDLLEVAHLSGHTETSEESFRHGRKRGQGDAAEDIAAIIRASKNDSDAIDQIQNEIKKW
jgi:hypothetical protein